MNKKQLFLKVAVCFIAILLATNNSFAEMRNSISQYGITWTFSTARECGQFVTGDWWVVGPVTITSVSPAPANRMNGSVVNPKNENCKQGYDGRYTPNSEYPDALYNASLRASFPLTLSGVNSLVSTASNTGGQNCTYSGTIMGWMNNIGDCQRGYLKSMAVLTVVDAAVPAGTFRPSYIGGASKEFINVSQIDYNVLPNLPAPGNLPDINRILRLFERPWLDHFGCWITQFIHAIDNAEGYGREMSNDVSEAAAYLMTNGAQRDELARRMIQRGIDVYGGLMNGAIWPADGGHASGRKWPVLFAGKLLNHSGMLAMGSTYVSKFGEDLQTYYRSGPSDPWWRFAPGREDYRPQYRTCCTSLTWVGQALTARMLHLDDEWNHNVYFEYVDRWIAESGAATSNYGGNDAGSFIRTMWETYRNNLPAEIPHGGGGPADTEAPSVPGGLATGTVTSSSVALSWNASTDNIQVAGYKVYTNGANPVNVGGTSTTISGLAGATQYTFTVSAYDAAGNESAQSSSVQATTLVQTGVTSNATFQSFALSTQTGTFTATFDAIPNAAAIDAVTGIQNGTATAYSSMACIIRFNTSNTIDARNGGTYTASNTVSYTPGVNYHFRVEVDVPTHTYSVYVTPDGGSEQTVALDFAFRSEQISVTQLTGWSIYAYAGSHSVDNMAFSSGVDTEAPSVPTGLTEGTVTSSSVALSWNASTDNIGVTGYKVYTDGANPVIVAGTSTTISSLTSDTQYSFSVSAIDEAGNESAQSSAIQVTTDFVDGEAPTVPGTPAASNVTTNSVDLSWTASVDNVAVVGYKIYTDGSYTKTVTGTSTTMTGLSAATQYSFTVSAIDAAGLESAQSSATLVTTDQLIGVTSSTAWQSFQESTQTSTFTATFDAIPNGSAIDALTGIQNGTASAYGDMACIIRFNTSGTIDARNGGTYTASSTVSYTSGVSYAFRVEVNIPSHTYSVYVTPAGGSEQTIASNFAFRSEQASVSQLTGWTIYAYAGSHTVSDMVFDDGSTPDTEAPSVPAGLSSSNVTTSSVDLSWNASTDNVGVTSYKVYTNGSNPVTVTGTSTTISGLADETQYSFTVSAVDAAANESAQSSAEVVTTNAIPAAVNIIANGEFDNGTTDWVAGNYAGTASLAAVTGQGLSGTNAMEISISAAGTNNWDIQIYQDIAIESGKTYEISFMAKAAASRSVAAVIQDTESPYSEYWHQDVNLTTSAQSFGPYTFNSSTTDATCRFKFFVGGNASTIYVDNIVVNDISQSSGAIEFAQSDASFKVYPNPLQGSELTLSINGYNSEEVTVIITDMMGRTVHNEVITVSDYSTANINANLSSGLYIISVNGESVFNQQKLIVE